MRDRFWAMRGQPPKDRRGAPDRRAEEDRRSGSERRAASETPPAPATGDRRRAPDRRLGARRGGGERRLALPIGGQLRTVIELLFQVDPAKLTEADRRRFDTAIFRLRFALDRLEEQAQV